MNKRILKKIRKNKHLSIINDIALNFNLTPIDVYFRKYQGFFDLGSYCICHFQFKEIPFWKFGIILNEKNINEYDIFGQPISLIDKFKPYYCPFAFTQDERIEYMKDFRILSKDPFGGDYDCLREENSEAIIIDEIRTKYYLEQKNIISELIEEFNESYKQHLQLTLKDWKTSVPRYSIDLGVNEQLEEGLNIPVIIFNTIKKFNERISYSLENDDYCIYSEGYYFSYFKRMHLSGSLGSISLKDSIKEGILS